MKSVTENFADCLEQTRELVELASQQDWSLLETKMQQRDQLIRQLLEQPVTPEQADEVGKYINQIKTLDQQTINMAEQQKEQILNELRKDEKGKKMKAAYGKTQRPY